MERKRSKGVSFLGAWLLVSGAVGIVRSIRIAGTIGSVPLFLVNAAWLSVGIACGLGLLQLKEWARRLTMAMQALSALLTAFFVLRMSDAEWEALLASMRVSSAEVPRSTLSAMVVALSLGWCACICFFLTRRAVKAQFSEKPETPETP